MISFVSSSLPRKLHDMEDNCYSNHKILKMKNKKLKKLESKIGAFEWFE